MPHTHTESNENTTTFPQRLMSLLEDETVQQAMHWLTSGRAFEISDPNLMTSVVLETHFNSIHLNSFLVRLKSECRVS